MTTPNTTSQTATGASKPSYEQYTLSFNGIEFAIVNSYLLAGDKRTSRIVLTLAVEAGYTLCDEKIAHLLPSELFYNHPKVKARGAVRVPTLSKDFCLRINMIRLHLSSPEDLYHETGYCWMHSDGKIEEKIYSLDNPADCKGVDDWVFIKPRR